MPQIQLDEATFRAVQQRAADHGYDSVDAYVADLLTEQATDQTHAGTPNLDHLFTPERMVEVDRISTEIKAGAKTYTDEEIREHFKRKSKSWRGKNQG